MKKILNVLILIVITYSSFAQYTVTKVIGTVKNMTSGEMLKAGSILRDDDKIGWSSGNDLIRVIVPGKGIYLVTPTERAEKEQSGMIIDLVKAALHIKYKEGYLSSRSGNDESIPAVFETESRVNSKNLFKEENKYVFDPHLYDASKGRFFLQIESPGSKTFIHPLRTISDTLILYASDFRTETETDPLNTTYKLGFFSKEKNSSESLAALRPFIDSSGEMETIMKLIIENVQADHEKMQDVCYEEVYTDLGKPPVILFRNTFNKLINEVSKK
jgi:hypothetical protein